MADTPRVIDLEWTPDGSVAQVMLGGVFAGYYSGHLASRIFHAVSQAAESERDAAYVKGRTEATEGARRALFEPLREAALEHAAHFHGLARPINQGTWPTE